MGLKEPVTQGTQLVCVSVKAVTVLCLYCLQYLEVTSCDVAYDVFKKCLKNESSYNNN